MGMGVVMISIPDTIHQCLCWFVPDDFLAIYDIEPINDHFNLFPTSAEAILRAWYIETRHKEWNKFYI